MAVRMRGRSFVLCRIFWRTLMHAGLCAIATGAGRATLRVIMAIISMKKSIRIFVAALLLTSLFPGFARAGSWSTQTTGITTNIEGVSFANASQGIAVGAFGKTLYTADSGYTWTAGTTAPSSTTLFDVDHLSSLVALAVGRSGMIIKSTNGGATWTQKTSGVTGDLYAIDAFNGSVAWAVGAGGVILRTADGGTTWTSQTSGVTVALYDVHAVTSAVAVAVGEGGAILRTTNSGTTWTAQTSGTSQTLRGVTADSGGVVLFAVGDTATSLSSPDTGSTWLADGTSGVTATETLSEIVANVGSGYYYALGATTVYALNTSTLVWESVATASSSLNDMSLASVSEVWIAGDSGYLASSLDLQDPTVTATLPTMATVDDEVTFTASYTDGVGVTSCTLTIEQNDVTEASSAMTLSGTTSGTASTTYTFTSSGTYEAQIRCYDAASNYGLSGVTSIDVTEDSSDTMDPEIVAVAVTSATAGTPVSFSTTYGDNVGVVSCDLVVDSPSESRDTVAMTIAGTTTGTAEAEYTFSETGVHTVRVRCYDAAGNSDYSPTASVTVSGTSSADTTAPTVGAVTPTTAQAGVSETLSASYSDDVGVVACTIVVNGNGTAMALSSGTASGTGMFSHAGTFSAYVTCIDEAGNIGTGSTTTITVSAASTDTTAPTISTVTPTTATQDSAVTLAITATDASGMQDCRLYVDDNDQGEMTAGSSGAYTRSYTFASSGAHTAYARCGDAVGNEGSGTSATITVAAAAATTSDTVDPTVGAITPDTATEDSAVTLQVSVEDSGGMGTCLLYVNSSYIGVMTIADGHATRSYTFTDDGDAVANAYCTDAAGNSTRGDSTTITIAAAEEEDEEAEAVEEADAGNLIKMACPGGEDVNDPCRAVYYLGEDGKRHAFPNENVYFTWYADFDDVIIVTDDYLASIMLGSNVTYHPGTTMVKFPSLSTVYAVGEEGELRAITSEEVATSIFGATWNEQIDDISEAFYGNYEFGDDIDATSDFDPDEVEASTDSIEDVM